MTEPEIEHIEQSQEQTHTPKPEPIEIPAKPPRFPKVENPKNEQLTGRATYEEACMIDEVMEAHRRPGETMDVVRLCLKMIEYLENDFLQTFKTRIRGYKSNRERKR